MRGSSLPSPPVPRRPLDILNVLVALILLALAIYGAIARRLETPALTLARQAGLLVALLVIVQIERRGSGRLAELIVDFYPIALIMVVFDSLEPLILAVGFPNQDAALSNIDRLLLGGQDAATLMRPLIRPWLSDLLHIAYCTYFFFPLVVGGAMWLRSHELARRFIFMIVLAFYVSYAGYFFVPAWGPRYVQWARNEETRVTPISRGIYDLLTSLENTKDDVFPSGHVMVSAACLIAVYGFSRRLFWVMLPAGIGLTIATVYCRYHYVIDVITGLALAAITVPVGYAIYDRFVGRALPAVGHQIAER